jgi:uncharacterized protein (UPF0332 family)
VTDAAAQLDQAARSLRSSRVLLADDDANGAMNRLYYALYHAACAALIARSIDIPKSHSGLIARFGATFVKTGEFPVHLGKLLNQVEHERLSADYTGDRLDGSGLPGLISQGEAFIAAIQATIGEPPSEKSLGR